MTAEEMLNFILGPNHQGGYTTLNTRQANLVAGGIRALEAKNKRMRDAWKDLEAKASDRWEGALEVARQDSVEGNKIQEAGSMGRSNTWQAVADIAKAALAAKGE